MDVFGRARVTMATAASLSKQSREVATKSYVDRKVQSVYHMAPRLTAEGYSANHHRIIDVQEPRDENDVCTKRYVTYQMKRLYKFVPSVFLVYLSNQKLDNDRNHSPPPLPLVNDDLTYMLASGLSRYRLHYDGVIHIKYAMPDEKHLKIQLNGDRVLAHNHQRVNVGDELSFHLMLTFEEKEAGKTVNDFPLYIELEYTLMK